MVIDQYLWRDTLLLKRDQNQSDFKKRRAGYRGEQSLDLVRLLEAEFLLV
jgi:hypothetical protein